jgi:integrase
LTFIKKNCPTLKTAQIVTRHAEQFVRYLRSIQVSPNGHKNSVKRPLMDNGVRYILETCRSLFVFAAKRRHLSPYSDNPFASLDLDRIPIDDAKPIIILTAEQEMQFLRACDVWQIPLFLTLMLTGMRPGELIYLLLPDDVDLDQGVIRVRNKPRLGWQVKTRTERDIPMVGVMVDVLRRFIGDRTGGPLIRRRGLLHSSPASDEMTSRSSMEEMMCIRVEEA